MLCTCVYLIFKDVLNISQSANAMKVTFTNPLQSDIKLENMESEN